MPFKQILTVSRFSSAVVQLFPFGSLSKLNNFFPIIEQSWLIPIDRLVARSSAQQGWNLYSLQVKKKIQVLVVIVQWYALRVEMTFLSCNLLIITCVCINIDTANQSFISRGRLSYFNFCKKYIVFCPCFCSSFFSYLHINCITSDAFGISPTYVILIAFWNLTISVTLFIPVRVTICKPFLRVATAQEPAALLSKFMQQIKAFQICLRTWNCEVENVVVMA